MNITDTKKDPKTEKQYKTISPQKQEPTDTQSTQITRNNIFTALKMSINDLISESVIIKCEYDIENIKTMRFINVMENFFFHGVKNIKNFVNYIQEILSEFEDGLLVFQLIQNLPNLKLPPSARFRALMAISLLRKQLSIFFRIILSSEKISNHYDDYSCIFSEEIEVIEGLLLPLSSLDFTFAINKLNLNYQLKPIDYSHFMNFCRKPPSMGFEVAPSEVDTKIINIFNQKTYLEERMTHLQLQFDEAKRELELKTWQLEESLKREELAKLQADTNEKDLCTYRQQQNVIIDSFKTKIAGENVSNEERIEGLKQKLALYHKELEEYKKEKLDAEDDRDNVKKALIAQRDQIITQGAKIKDLTIQVEESKHTIGLLTRELGEKNESVGFLEKIQQIKTTQIQQLEDKISKNATLLQSNENLINKLKEENGKNSAEVLKLSKKLSLEIESKETVEALYAQERLERRELEERLSYQESANSSLKRELSRLVPYEKELESLREKYEKLSESHKEQEDALIAMGSQMQSHNLMLDELQETTLTQPKWIGDNQQPNCTLCEQNFSVSKRRHHCRRCGLIFCNECSDHRVVLPSFVKPVRVCDPCFRSNI